jgi:hypothetical protein
VRGRGWSQWSCRCRERRAGPEGQIWLGNGLVAGELQVWGGGAGLMRSTQA